MSNNIVISKVVCNNVNVQMPLLRYKWRINNWQYQTCLHFLLKTVNKQKTNKTNMRKFY